MVKLFKEQETAKALFEAAESGQSDIVKVFVLKGYDLDQQDRLGRTALYLACKNGHKGVFLELLQGGALLDKEALDGTTPWDVAMQNGHKEIALELQRRLPISFAIHSIPDFELADYLSHQINLNELHFQEGTLPEMLAFERRVSTYFAKANMTLQKVKNELNISPWQPGNFRFELLQEWITNTETVIEKQQKRWKEILEELLLQAIRKGQEHDVATLLLLNPELHPGLTEEDVTPLVNHLNEKNRPDIKGHVLSFILSNAINYGQDDLACYLVNEGAHSTNHLTNHFLLHNACRTGCVNAAKAMIERQSEDIATEDERGDTPLSIAEKMGYHELVLAIEEHLSIESGIEEIANLNELKTFLSKKSLFEDLETWVTKRDKETDFFRELSHINYTLTKAKEALNRLNLPKEHPRYKVIKTWIDETYDKKSALGNKYLSFLAMKGIHEENYLCPITGHIYSSPTYVRYAKDGSLSLRPYEKLAILKQQAHRPNSDPYTREATIGTPIPADQAFIERLDLVKEHIAPETNTPSHWLSRLFGVISSFYNMIQTSLTGPLPVPDDTIDAPYANLLMNVEVGEIDLNPEGNFSIISKGYPKDPGADTDYALRLESQYGTGINWHQFARLHDVPEDILSDTERKFVHAIKTYMRKERKEP